MLCWLQVGEASYVWLPLLPQDDGSYMMHWYDHWTPGEIKPQLQAPLDVRVPDTTVA